MKLILGENVQPDYERFSVPNLDKMPTWAKHQFILFAGNKIGELGIIDIIAYMAKNEILFYDGKAIEFPETTE